MLDWQKEAQEQALDELAAAAISNFEIVTEGDMLDSTDISFRPLADFER